MVELSPEASPDGGGAPLYRMGYAGDTFNTAIYMARDESHAVDVHRPEGRTATPAPERVKAVDTTGAGDSFNAAYLSSRLSGLPIPEAVRRAHGLAALVVSHRGPIVPNDVPLQQRLPA